MNPTFVLSIDTELAWGTRGDAFYRTDYERTRDVIGRLLALLARYEIPATWAVVGHLFLDSCARDAKGVLHPEIVRPEGWTGKNDWFLMDPGTSRLHDPIWYGDDVIDLIKSCAYPQEIGSHSFSHFYADACSRESFASDTAEAVRVSREAEVAPVAYVFPQNRVNHLDVLREQGFTCYRGCDENWYRRLPKLLKKVAHMVDDYFIPTAPAVQPRLESGLVNIPGSWFYGHARGWAKYLPVRMRVAKVKAGLRAAMNEKGVFHLWFHPFNLASDPEGLLQGLEDIFKYVQELRVAGKLETSSMGQLAARVKAEKKV
jgi:peptidoglycan/xylan/chitin deacetylase (PgdA/CDA1 family)